MIMKDIIQKLKELTGPDQSIDAHIASTVGGLNGKREFGMAGNWWIRWTDNGSTVGLPAYTSSVDIAIALATKILPDYQVGFIPNFYEDKSYAGIISKKGKPVDLIESTIAGGATPAIAICHAILKVYDELSIKDLGELDK